MFGFGKKKKPKTALDSFITAVYGDPPPPKRANVPEAARLASDELLMGNINSSEVTQLAQELASGPVPYSTHDLALSVALNFFKRQECMERLWEAQMFARLKMVEWFQEGLVAPMIVKSFEEVLYKLYKP
ncbi:MAG: hypothetical protein H8E24_00080 [Verrucomicrobia bacterium]|nr:hypothetical protein [Verrucomicrobiota bacterium]